MNATGIRRPKAGMEQVRRLMALTVNQWERAKGGASRDWRRKEPIGGQQQVPVRRSRGKVERFARPLFTAVSADKRRSVNISV